MRKSLLRHRRLIYHNVQDRFGVKYTHCGCPVPGETIGQRMSRMMTSYTPRSPSYLKPPQRDDLLAATHPSDHNAVFAFHHKRKGDVSRSRRREKLARRQEREVKAAAVNADSQRNARNNGHDAAFLMPVPMYFYAPVGGCAATSGHVVNGGGGGVGGCAAVSELKHM